ncbi:MAG: UpxY family transcription antiterminator [Chlorobi bacterium]|nr:UpxY family transcription antiterminator [Chlorobiota bacterium]
MPEKIWYAVYVKSRSEKKVALEFEFNDIDYYLPLIKKLKIWSDRKKWVEEPLFRSYIFVHIDQKDYFKVLQTINVVKYISFEGMAVPIRNEQIEAVRYYLNEKDPENIDNQVWETGRKVKVVSGSLIGLEGELIDIRGKKKVKVEIEAVGRTLIIQIPKSKLEFVL